MIHKSEIFAKITGQLPADGSCSAEGNFVRKIGGHGGQHGQLPAEPGQDKVEQ